MILSARRSPRPASPRLTSGRSPRRSRTSSSRSPTNAPTENEHPSPERRHIMNVPFRGFSAILYKEFLAVLRDPFTLFFMLFPPLVEMIAFGYALDTDVKHMATMVFDEDRTTESRQLIDQFVNTQTFKVVGEVHSIKELADAIRQGKAYVGIQIPPDFTRNMRAGRTARLQVLIDGSNSSIASSSLNTSLNVAFRNAVIQIA